MDVLKPFLALAISLAAVSPLSGQGDTWSASAKTAGDRNPRPKLTRQPSFYIPFQLSAQHASEPVEVHLYVSADQGAKWEPFQQQKINAERFRFTAPADGEYWFAVRTVDRRGQLIAHQGWRPELIVIVDTQKPQLDLKVEVDSHGNTRASWTAQDPNLAAHSFRLQYQEPRTQRWQDVKVRTPNREDWRQSWEQEANWWLQAAGHDVLVRAEVLDRAGNSTLVTKNLSVMRVATQRERAASRYADTSGIDAGAAQSQTESNSPTARRGNQRPGLAGLVPPLVNDRDADRSQGNQSTSDADAVRRFDDLAGAPLSSDVAPPVANRQSPLDRPANDLRPFRVTSSPAFELTYQLYDLGPSGASLVELWYTRDGGQTWAFYQRDDDAKSPVKVRLDQEGRYGFRLVVYGHDAPAPRPPQRGDKADLQVDVDMTRPTAEITGAHYEDGTLLITWQADDANLGEKAITLKFRESASAPWNTIVSHQANTGTYQWRLGRQPSRQLELQLEARDLAGNVTTHQMSQLMLNQGRAPAGRIREFRPLGQVSFGTDAVNRRR